jgi:hypothetical protein
MGFQNLLTYFAKKRQRTFLNERLRCQFAVSLHLDYLRTALFDLGMPCSDTEKIWPFEEPLSNNHELLKFLLS